MAVTDLARRRLPAPVQDGLRLAADRLHPGRRASARRPADASLARAVSPDGVVLAGPFEGLRLELDASWGGLASRLAGTYELEIQPWMADVVRVGPELVVDIGAAEGYYAVGLARAMPSSHVVAMDIDPHARALCRRNARINGVDNVSTIGRATHGRLRRILKRGCWVLCDVEGFEDVLLDPAAVPSLLACSLVVELHEFASPGVTRRLIERFEGTHDVSRVAVAERPVDDLQHLHHLDGDTLRRAVAEGRPAEPPMEWVLLTPRGVLRS